MAQLVTRRLQLGGPGLGGLMGDEESEILLNIPLQLPPSAIPPSTLAPQVLPVIPGSIRNTPNPSPPDVSPAGVFESTGAAGPSRPAVRTPAKEVLADEHLLSPPGSYFPSGAFGSSHTSPGHANSAYATPRSGTSTPGDRPRPAPIDIPASTPNEPTFSAYPPVHDPPSTSDSASAGPSRPSSSRGTARTFVFPLKPAFQLVASPRIRRKRAGSAASASGDDSPAPELTARHSPDVSTMMTAVPTEAATSSRKGRRRAATLSHPSSELGPKHEERRGTGSMKISRLAAVTPTKSLGAARRRRMSFGGAPHDPEYTADDGPQWPKMASSEFRRFERTVAKEPFDYTQTGVEYALQSVPTVAQVRPLTSPSISPRRSSLVPDLSDVSLASTAKLLGLHDLGDSPAGTVEVVLPDDLARPFPPPRLSSLDLASTNIPAESPTSPPLHLRLLATTSAPEVSDIQLQPAGDRTSFLSASAGTDTSASATDPTDFFTPSPSSHIHPLSSASTSISRSVKSGHEGHGNISPPLASPVVEQPTFSALNLQRSLELEQTSSRLSRRMEKRRLIMLELVETEVAYTEDLKTLVQIYLPQLYALPSVSERTADHVARNAKQLWEFHSGLSRRMVDILKAETVGYFSVQEGDEGKLERAARRLSELLVLEVAGFAPYRDYCSGSIAAATLVGHIVERTDYEAFEKRCQIISTSQPDLTLRDLLEDRTPVSLVPSNRSRLKFRDFLIMPIQRICRYPLLLSQLLASGRTVESVALSPQGDTPVLPPSVSAPTSPDLDGSIGLIATGEQPLHAQPSSEYDTGVDIERALGAMRGVAEEADEARRLKDAEIKSATVIERLEPNPALTPAFLRSLGTCRLIGSLDVLHHHPTVAPLTPPVKVKYLAAFLYRGYLILAKVKKNKMYEAKHWLPLEVFELIDITEGFLPHSIRLSLREHNFDLAASCAAEKVLWAAALVEAREASIIPPFELPASVSPFAARPRRMSIVNALTIDTAISEDFGPSKPTSPETSQELKRHTLAALPTGVAVDFGMQETTSPVEEYAQGEAIPGEGADKPLPATPQMSPHKRPLSLSYSVNNTPDKHGRASTLLLRRASTAQRSQIDRNLIDVFSESCAQARSKAQLHQPLFPTQAAVPGGMGGGSIPSPTSATSSMRERLTMRDSSMLRRRRSFLDLSATNNSPVRTRPASFDIAVNGDVRGSIIPVRVSRDKFTQKRRTLSQYSVYSAGPSGPPSRIHSRRASLSGSVDGSDGNESSTEREPRSRASEAGTIVASSEAGFSLAMLRRSSSFLSSPANSPRSSFRQFGSSGQKTARIEAPDLTVSRPTPTRLGSMLSLPSKRRTTSQHDLTAAAAAAAARAKSVPASPVVGARFALDKEVPPLPSAPRLLKTLSDPPSTRSDGAYPMPRTSESGRRPLADVQFIPHPSDQILDSGGEKRAPLGDGPSVPIYSLGNGLTNQATPPQLERARTLASLSGMAGTLKRSMSLISRQGGSSAGGAGLAFAGSTMSGSASGSGIASTDISPSGSDFDLLNLAGGRKPSDQPSLVSDSTPSMEGSSFGVGLSDASTSRSEEGVMLEKERESEAKDPRDGMKRKRSLRGLFGGPLSRLTPM